MKEKNRRNPKSSGGGTDPTVFIGRSVGGFCARCHPPLSHVSKWRLARRKRTVYAIGIYMFLVGD